MKPFKPDRAALHDQLITALHDRTERTSVDAQPGRLPVAAVVLVSPCRDHCSKSSAIFKERWLDAGGMCIGLADPGRYTA